MSLIRLFATATRPMVCVSHSLPRGAISPIFGYASCFSTDTKTADVDAETTGEEKVTEQSEKTSAEEPEATPVDEMSAMLLQLETAHAKANEMEDRWKRAVADSENTRNIAKKDVSNARLYALQGFSKQLLDVSDNLNRAMSSIPAEVLAEERNSHLRALAAGVEMTSKQLTKVFVANGIEEYAKVGDVFDPQKHDALFEITDPNAEVGTIGEVMKTGFCLNGRVIRAAQVGTFKASE